MDNDMSDTGFAEKALRLWQLKPANKIRGLLAAPLGLISLILIIPIVLMCVFLGTTAALYVYVAGGELPDETL